MKKYLILLIVLFLISFNFSLTKADTITATSNTTISDDLDFDNDIKEARTYNISSGVTYTINGAINGGHNITKTNSGTLVLTGNNNLYSADTTISAGAIAVGHNNALGSEL